MSSFPSGEKIRLYLQLIRWKNSLLFPGIFTASFILIYLFECSQADLLWNNFATITTFYNFMIMLTLSSTVACAMAYLNIENDLSDLAIDRIVHETRPLASGQITIEQARDTCWRLEQNGILNFLLLILFIILAEQSNCLLYAKIAFVLAFQALILIYFYNHRFSKTLIGNFIIAWCTGSVCLAIYLIYISLFKNLFITLYPLQSPTILQNQLIVISQAVFFALFLALLCGIREFLKDCLDYRGDEGIRTTWPLLLKDLSNGFNNFLRSRRGQNLCWFYSAMIKILMGAWILVFNVVIVLNLHP